MSGYRTRCVRWALVFVFIAGTCAALSLSPRWEFTVQGEFHYDYRHCGLTHDGTHFWSNRYGTDSALPTFRSYDSNGLPVNTWKYSPSTQYGYHDSGWYNNYLWGSECSLLHAYWTCGGYAGYVYGPDVFSPSTPIRSVSWKGNTCYVGGWGTRVYKGSWNGAFGTTPSWEPLTESVVPQLTGLAADPENHLIWMTRSDSQRIWTIDEVLGEVAPGPVVVMPGNPMGAARYGEPIGDFLAVLYGNCGSRSEDIVVVYEITPTAADETSWSEVKALY